MKNLMRGAWWLAIGVLLSQGVSQGSDPSAEVMHLIQERRANMVELGATLRAAWEKFDTGDLATLGLEAQRIRDEALRISGFYPPGSFREGSRARATISEEQEEFRRLSTELRVATEALLDQAKTQKREVIRALLLQVGSACRACHTKFVEHPR